MEFIMNFENIKIAVIGLGYVGLPLAIEFSKKFNTVGFDIKSQRVKDLSAGVDNTLEVSVDDLKETNLDFTLDEGDISDANVFIVTVPTPIDRHRQPDLTPLIKASELIGRVMQRGSIVIYESTVYPGATEDDCIPVIEETSGFVFNKDFYAGYSPERINPGDKERPLTKIMKVTSGSTPEAADFVDNLYKSIIQAGTFKAASIKVAEASKVIENTQRDVNIALINELSVIFDNIGINTHDVIEAASTKWNFIKLFPGLVGGHCIGVDPYYLVHKSMSVGYVPDMIRTAREINDGMPRHISTQFVKSLIKNDIKVKEANVLVLGMTFKENCPDIRNTKVIDLINDIVSYGMHVDVFDPWVCKDEVFNEYGISVLDRDELGRYDGVILAVSHDDFRELYSQLPSLYAEQYVLFDLKNFFK